MTSADADRATAPASALSEVVDVLLRSLDTAAARGTDPPVLEDLVASASRSLSYESEEFCAFVAGLTARLTPHLRPRPELSDAVADAVADAFSGVVAAISMQAGRHLGPALSLSLCLTVELAQLRGITPAQLLAELIAVDQAGGPDS